MNLRAEREDLEDIDNFFINKIFFKKDSFKYFFNSFCSPFKLFWKNLLFLATFIALTILLTELYKIFNIKTFQTAFYLNILINIFSFTLVYYNNYDFLVLIYISGIIISLFLLKKRFLFITLIHLYLLFPAILLLVLNQSSGGNIIILWMFIVVWSSDIAGYVFEKLLKQIKLYFSISN